MEVLADGHYFSAFIVSHFHVLKELVSHHLKCIFRPRLTKNKNKKATQLVPHNYFDCTPGIVPCLDIYINNASHKQGRTLHC